jgi:single-strand DNA-binding protein
MRAVKGTINAVELLGWLGGDPELRFTPGGAKYCRFSIATRRPAGRDEGGNREYETEWIYVESWERLAELCNSYLHKGSRVRVSGSLRNDSWNDKDSGQLRTRSYVRAEDILFLDARPGQPVEVIEETPVAADDIPF